MNAFPVIACACMLFAASCGRAKHYEHSIKELDSLNIVVEQALDNFVKLDSASYQQALNKQFTYSTFIGLQVHDTVTGPEAQLLQEFYTSGKPFKEFLDTRHRVIEEARTSASQLKKLSQDLATDAVDQDKAIEYIHNEKQEADKIIARLKQSSDLLHQQMESFNRTLPQVELFVKRYNHGVLPPIMPAE